MDDCKICEYLELCRNGQRPPCPWQIETSIYNPNIPRDIK